MKYHKRRLWNEFIILLQRIFTPRNIIALVLVFLFLFVLVPVMVISSLMSSYQARVTDDPEDISPSRAVLVLAAPVELPEEQQLFENRVSAAVELYVDDRIDQIIISGAEPEVASSLNLFAQQKGVNPDDIVMDGGSVRTYDSCYRTKHEYGLSSAVVISQELHLVRALYICNSLGMNAQGYIAAEAGKPEEGNWLQEMLAFAKAVWEVNIAPPM